MTDTGLTGTEMALLRVLLDKEAIRDVLNRYCRAMDRCDAELLQDVFHDDAREDHGGLHEGSAREFCSLAIDYVRKMGVVVHYLSNVTINVTGESAVAESYGIALHRIDGEDGSFDSVFGARLLDRFEKRQGVWRIIHRRVVYDWNRDAPVAESWGRGFFAGQPQGGSKDRNDPSYTLFPTRARSGPA